MKDYTINFENSNKFVLNYVIKDNYITVNFANGENYIIPYTPANEEKLLARMEMQVLQSDKCLDKQHQRYRKSCKWALYNIIFFVLNTLLILTGNPNFPIFTGICSGYFALTSAFDIYRLIDSKKIINDINKNKLFIINKEKINKNIEENQNVLCNVSNKTKELVQTVPIGSTAITINSVDKIKYEELKQILTNIDREQEFDFDCTSVIKDKQLVKKK